MQTQGRNLRARQVSSVFILALALGALGVTAHQGSAVVGNASLPVFLILPVLIAGLVLSYQFPLHLRHQVKIQISSVPFYLMAALLPPVEAGLVALCGFGLAELSVRQKRGNTYSVVAIHAGRFALVALAGSGIAHLQLPVGRALLQELPLAGAALVLLAGDLLTLPLALVPISAVAIRRIVTQALTEGGKAEGAQYFVGLLGALVVMQQVWALALLALPTVLTYLAFRRQLDNTTVQLLAGMAETVESRSPYTRGHSQRVAELAQKLLAELRMQGPEAKLIVAVALVHDIGKIGLPDLLLRKEGVLGRDDWEVIESHVVQGAELLGRYPDFERGVEMVRHHHEHWDGSGYPGGLAGEEIPFGARVIALCDAYIALTSHRPYRRALSAGQAALILTEGQGRQWDPELVEPLLRVLAPEIADQPAVPLLRVVGGSHFDSSGYSLPPVS